MNRLLNVHKRGVFHRDRKMRAVLAAVEAVVASVAADASAVSHSGGRSISPTAVQALAATRDGSPTHRLGNAPPLLLLTS